jgi:hypothetical protein
MNERIKQLLVQAQYLAREEVKSMPEFEKYAPSYAIPGTEIHVGIRLSYEKFAELIVQECISIVDEQKECLHEEQQYWHDRDYGYEMAVNDASMGIKQFFGVEE